MECFPYSLFYHDPSNCIFFDTSADLMNAINGYLLKDKEINAAKSSVLLMELTNHLEKLENVDNLLLLQNGVKWSLLILNNPNLNYLPIETMKAFAVLIGKVPRSSLKNLYLVETPIILDAIKRLMRLHDTKYTLFILYFHQLHDNISHSGLLLYYSELIKSSNAFIPINQLVLLNKFIDMKWVVNEDILPFLSKGLLRTPERCLPILAEFLKVLALSEDAYELLNSLSKQVLSTSAAIRDAAFNCFFKWISSLNVVNKDASFIFNAIKKLLTDKKIAWDIRKALIETVFLQFKFNKQIVDEMIELSEKETHEEILISFYKFFALSLTFECHHDRILKLLDSSLCSKPPKYQPVICFLIENDVTLLNESLFSKLKNIVQSESNQVVLLNISFILLHSKFNVPNSYISDILIPKLAFIKNFAIIKALNSADAFILVKLLMCLLSKGFVYSDVLSTLLNLHSKYIPEVNAYLNRRKFAFAPQTISLCLQNNLPKLSSILKEVLATTDECWKKDARLIFLIVKQYLKDSSPKKIKFFKASLPNNGLDLVEEMFNLVMTEIKDQISIDSFLVFVSNIPNIANLLNANFQSCLENAIAGDKKSDLDIFLNFITASFVYINNPLLLENVLRFCFEYKQLDVSKIQLLLSTCIRKHLSPPLSHLHVFLYENLIFKAFNFEDKITLYELNVALLNFFNKDAESFLEFILSLPIIAKVFDNEFLDPDTVQSAMINLDVSLKKFTSKLCVITLPQLLPVQRRFEHLSMMAEELFVSLCHSFQDYVQIQTLVKEALSSSSSFNRHTALSALKTLDKETAVLVKILSFDSMLSISEKAQTLLVAQNTAYEYDQNYFLSFITNEVLGEAASKALADYLKNTNEADFTGCIKQIISTFNGLLSSAKAKAASNIRGRSASEDEKETKASVQKRIKLSFALKYIFMNLNEVSEEMAIDLAKFFLNEAFSDLSVSVAESMLQSCLAFISLTGKVHLKILMPLFRQHVATTKSNSNTEEKIRQYVVICVGSLAEHLTGDTEENNLTNIIEILEESLKTPSESVQLSTSKVLAPLLKKKSKEFAYSIAKKYLSLCLDSKTVALRRGYSFGFVAAASSIGLNCVYDFWASSILASVNNFSKNSEGKREAALFCMELLAAHFGREFEPYVFNSFSLVVSLTGDNSADVRLAALDALKYYLNVVLQSAALTKMVLPVLLDTLTETSSWRVKTAILKCLAHMAAEASKNPLIEVTLSPHLSNVVPKLSKSLSEEPHSEVKLNCKQALLAFTEIVKSPEIARLSPILLSSLSSEDGLAKALKSLLNTSFCHYIDAPSLSLLAPIILKSFSLSSTSFNAGGRAAFSEDQECNLTVAELKIKGLTLLGNLVYLCEEHFFKAYLPSFLQGLLLVLADPIPGVRSTAARVLGTLVAELGEGAFPTLVNDIFERLQGSECESPGLAEALSEILLGLGIERLVKILKISEISNPTSKLGFISFLYYVPLSFGDELVGIDDVFNVVLPVLFDSIKEGSLGNGLMMEKLRDASSRSAERWMHVYYKERIHDFFPLVIEAATGSHWRLRLVGLQLLIQLINSVIVNNSFEAESSAKSAHSKLEEVLGIPRTEHLLSVLYTLRLDSHAGIRSSASMNWKSVIINTPRTLTRILPTMLNLCIDSLSSSSSSPDKKEERNEEACERAARTIGDLIRKLGDRLLDTHILPHLSDSALLSTSSVGVSLLLAEVYNSITKVQAHSHRTQLLTLSEKCLMHCPDRNGIVYILTGCHHHFPDALLNSVLPRMLECISVNEKDSFSSQKAIASTIEILRIIPDESTSSLMSFVFQKPFSAATVDKIKCFAAFIDVLAEKDLLNNYVIEIFENLFDFYHETMIEDYSIPIRIFQVANDELFSTGLLSYLLEKLPIEKESVLAANFVADFIVNLNATVDFWEFVSDIISMTLIHLPSANSKLSSVVALKIFPGLLQRFSKEKMVTQIQLVHSLISDVNDLSALNSKAALNPFISLFSHALLYSSKADQRVEAVNALNLLLSHKEIVDDGLKFYSVQLLGLLIRSSSDRPAKELSSLLFQSIHLLLNLYAGIEVQLKPFSPQLQRVILKAVTGENEEANGQPDLNVMCSVVCSFLPLLAQQVKPDGFIQEMFTLLKNSTKSSQKYYLLRIFHACYQYCSSPSANTLVKISDGAIEEIIDYLTQNYLVGKEQQQQQGDNSLLIQVTCMAVAYGCKLLSNGKKKEKILNSLLNLQSNNIKCQIQALLALLAVNCVTLTTQIPTYCKVLSEFCQKIYDAGNDENRELVFRIFLFMPDFKMSFVEDALQQEQQSASVKKAALKYIREFIRKANEQENEQKQSLCNEDKAKLISIVQTLNNRGEEAEAKKTLTLLKEI